MANIQFKKRDNGPNLKFFECSETIQLFDSIRQWIQKNCKKVGVKLATHKPIILILQQSFSCIVIELFVFLI